MRIGRCNDLSRVGQIDAMVPLLFCILTLTAFLKTSLALDSYERCHLLGSNATVQAFKYSYPPVKSCRSSLADDDREVHVVHLCCHKTLDSPSVKINLHGVSNDNASVILILLSDVDLTWNLVLPDVDKSNLAVWISRNTVLKSKVRPVTFNLQEYLSEWIHSKFGGITSHVEIAHPIDVIDLHLGKGIGRLCQLIDNKKQRFAYKKQDAVTLGCIFSNESSALEFQPGYRRDIHVIEFHSLPSGEHSTNPHKKPIITLRLKTKSLVNIDAVIIIMSDFPATFKVKMGPFTGKVNIHTNQEVNNDAVNDQTLAVSAESFDFRTSEDLYAWTKLHHGIPHSFSRVLEANFVELLIEDHQSFSLMNASPVEEMSVQPSKILLDLAHDVSVACHEEFFSVAIVKQEGLSSCDWLTLSDEMCRAQSNSSHCIMETKYGHCKACLQDGVRKNGEGCDVGDTFGKYKNEILVHNLSDRNDAMSTPPYKIKLDCSTASITSNDNAYRNSNNNDIHKSDFYFKLLIHNEELSSVKEKMSELRSQKYYVEAVVIPEGKIIVTIEDCRLESLIPWKTGYVHHLIRKRCPVGSVEWRRFPSGKRPLPPILSFDLDEALVNYNNTNTGKLEKNFWRVACRVTPCFIANMTAPDIPQCGAEDYSKCEKTQGIPSYSLLKRFVVNVTSHPLPSFVNKHEQPEHFEGGHHDGKEVKTREEILHLMLTGSDSTSQGRHNSAPACVEGEGRLDKYVTMEIGIVVSFCAFLIGLLSMSALWFIYAKTRPKKPTGSKHLRSPDTSGESTPSSTSPITICQIKRSK